MFCFFFFVFFLSLQISTVVNQLKDYPRFLHTYLHALFKFDPHRGSDFHELQVALYAEYDYKMLLPFLRQSNYYPLEKAYKVCEGRGLVPEMVFILGRMGNNKQALTLIIEKLKDVKQAIEFAKEQNDEELWEDLIRYSLDKPDFITGLLQNVGSHVDPIKLIKRIPKGLKIPELKMSLIKILQDYNLQTLLREGCRQILTTDCVDLMERWHKEQRRGILLTDNTACCTSSRFVFGESKPFTMSLGTRWRAASFTRNLRKKRIQDQKPSQAKPRRRGGKIKTPTF